MPESSKKLGRPRRRKAFADLTGERFGMLVVVRRGEDVIYPSGYRANMWVCLCDCGTEICTRQGNLVSKGSKSCGCHRKMTMSIMMSKAVGELSGSYWCGIRRNAHWRGLPLEITQEYAWDLFLEQDRRCSITGMLLTMAPRYGSKVIGDRELQTASLDRIDVMKGYIEGNVRWVHKVVNIMRGKMTDDELTFWCRLIIEGYEAFDEETLFRYNHPVSRNRPPNAELWPESSHFFGRRNGINETASSS